MERVTQPNGDKIKAPHGYLDMSTLSDDAQANVIVVARAFLDRVQSSLDVDLRAPVDGELALLRKRVTDLTVQLLMADIRLAQEADENTQGQTTLMAVVISAMRRLGLSEMDVPDDELFSTITQIRSNPGILDAESHMDSLRMVYRP